MSKNLSLHHANLLIGTPEEAQSYLRSLSDGWGFGLPNNPDFFAFQTETFGIDEARELKLLSARKAFTHRKIFFIAPMRLTLEAQNALLKTFEDPFLDTYFFLVMREESLVIPTLLSRMQVIRTSGGHTSGSTEAGKFLSLSIRERLLFAHQFAEKEQNLPIFLDNLLVLLRKQKEKKDFLENVYNVRRFVRDYAPSSRLVIEHLSLVL